MKSTYHISVLLLGMTLPFQACEGLFENVYDKPDESRGATTAGQLYIDASDWLEWHYIDLIALTDSVNSDESYNTSSAWQTFRIPLSGESSDNKTGIYTYWYDVFGEGITKYEYRDFIPTASQPEPSTWSVAVHRNNVRTNGGSACVTEYTSIDEIPDGTKWLDKLEFVADQWDETGVWVIQDRMLLGIIGNQGITTNPELSSWLTIRIPPMPPSFVLDSRVRILRLADGTYAAMQLTDYQSVTGTKCCLTINYKYPL